MFAHHWYLHSQTSNFCPQFQVDLLLVAKLLFHIYVMSSALYVFMFVIHIDILPPKCLGILWNVIHTGMFCDADMVQWFTNRYCVDLVVFVVVSRILLG